MDSLVGYGSDDEHENDRYGGRHTSGARRREDDTNYEEVNMDMSEDSQQESEPELPQAEHHEDRTGSADSRDRSRGGSRDRRDRGDRRRESPRRDRADRGDRARDRRSPRRDDRPNRSDRHDRNRGQEPARRGLLGDRPDEKSDKPPALMDLKFGDGPGRSHDARDAVSPRFVDRDRRDRDKGSRERERDRDNRGDRHSRRDEDRRSREPRDGRERHEERGRARPGAAFPPPPPPHHHPHPHPPHAAGSSSGYSERRSPTGDYKPSSYKVNRKLEVMEKMGLQIKTPDGSMATAQQLRAAAHEPGQPGALPTYYNSQANKILDQVNKRKLLWAHKKEEKSEAEKAAPWTGTRFAADQDGRQTSKFMRLMGIKDPEAVKQEVPEKTADPIKKQEELFQAMQAQYEVARATTHTMRGVGLGFQRGQY